MKYNSTGLSLRLREQVSGEVIDGGLSAINIWKSQAQKHTQAH